MKKIVLIAMMMLAAVGFTVQPTKVDAYIVSDRVSKGSYTSTNVWGGRANVTNAGATKYTMYVYNPNGTKYLIHGKQGTIKQPLYTTSGKKISTAAVTVTSKNKMRVAFIVGKKTTIYFFSKDVKM